MSDGQEWKTTGDDRGPKVPAGRRGSLSVLAGQSLKRMREEAGVRQADIAAAANALGLKWGRSSVAALETGTRSLSAEEYAILPRLLATAQVPYDRLIADDDIIEISDKCAIYGKELRTSNPGYRGERLVGHMAPVGPAGQGKATQGLRDVFSLGGGERIGLFPESVSREADPRLRAEWAGHALEATLIYLLGQKVWPSAGKSGAARVLASQPTELEMKVAKQLGAGARIVSLMAISLWGRSMDSERDARTEERGTYKDKMALRAARGYVTRGLIKEMKSEWSSKHEAIANIMSEVPRNVEATEQWVQSTWENYLEPRFEKDGGR